MYTSVSLSYVSVVVAQDGYCQPSHSLWKQIRKYSTMFSAQNRQSSVPWLDRACNLAPRRVVKFVIGAWDGHIIVKCKPRSDSFEAIFFFNVGQPTINNNNITCVCYFEHTSTILVLLFIFRSRRPCLDPPFPDVVELNTQFEFRSEWVVCTILWRLVIRAPNHTKAGKLLTIRP